ncbi:unnamed protein product [Clonostachys rhizophaga]|uniref:Uncharacterized protein n=1 Tax=Clonostachys rhizophaga TaxID=160324 RepID=A0A9N9V4P8_9HYPO|nr:unnamed protein product [Clonostachys rhizophaga]
MSRIICARSADKAQGGVLALCLKLWMAARLIETPWQICGRETLGLRIIDDPDHIFHGKIPVTPVMDTQLDRIVIQSILIPLRHEVLKKIQDKIFKKDPAMWFDLLAAVFISLNTIEIAVGHDHEFATLYGHVLGMVKYMYLQKC